MQAMFLLGVTFFALIISPTMGKRCELAKQLKASGMDGYKGVPFSTVTFVCMTSFKSDRLWYTVFQINSRWGCEDGETPGSKNACKISCNALQNDDITDDIKCAKRVVRNPSHLLLHPFPSISWSLIKVSLFTTLVIQCKPSLIV
uniref:lysozyme n=1 Tax=Erpetoichthys calabaricus TaxID=27687 RepID=A0A8C4T8E8_ERPCA